MRTIVLLLLVGLSGLPLLADEGAVHRIETKNYLLVAEGGREEAEEYGRLLEAAYRKFQKFFRGKPKLSKGKRLEVRFFLDAARLEAAARTDGTDGTVAVDGADGARVIYDSGSRVAFALAGESPYQTRCALLRAAARQFHLIARARDKLPTAAWYADAIADYLAGHFWDGEELRVGVMPLLTYDNFAAKAVEELQQPDFDLAKAIEGPMSRPVGWTLVRYLMQGEKGKPHPKWSAFVKKMDGGVAPAGSFRRHFGKAEEMQRPLLLWADRHQQPFAPIHGGWEAIAPDRIRGTSKGLSACYLTGNTSQLHAVIRVPREKKRWVAGLLLHGTDRSDFTVALFDWGGHIRVHRYVSGGRRILAQGAGPGPDEKGRYVLDAYRQGDKVFFALGPMSYGPYEAPGKTLGLALERCSFVFEELSWK